MRRAAAASMRLICACATGERSTKACVIRGSDHVVGVAAPAGDKAQILVTPHGLANAEFHAASSHTKRSSTPDRSYPAIRVGRISPSGRRLKTLELGEYSRAWQRNSLIPTGGT